MEIIQKISEKYNVESLDGVEGVWFYDISTPIFKIRHYLFYDKTKSNIFCLSQKDSFFIDDIPIYKSLLERLDLNEALNKDFILLEAASTNHVFDRLAVTHGDYHSAFKSDIPSVYKDTYVIFPCHHSEFLASDTAEDVNFCRNRVVKTLIWDREISPRVYLKFENKNNGVKTNGEEFLFGDFDYIMDLIDQLMIDDGFLVVENYKRQQLELVFLENNCVINGDFELNSNEPIELKGRVRKFMID
jgi:hypothetical protein